MARTPPLLRADEARSLLDLNVETGELRWTSAASQGRLTQKVAGGIANNGYRAIKIGRKSHLAHRLVWLIVHGEWPAGQIDHIDGNRTNNAISNLRCVTAAQNKQNIAVTGRKTLSGLAGATFIPGGSRRRDKWESRIKVNGKSTHLGHFDTPEEAHAAYVSAKRQVHPYFSRATN